MIDSTIQNTDQYDILIVDDTPASLELLGRILDERGYRIRPAPNGRHALNSVAARLPDLILLDVKMPEMDGYEVCRRLKSKEKSRNVPVIFISAHGETANKVEGFKAGGVDYIAKPFEREEVIARVETQLRLHELTERLEQQVDQRTRQLRQEILAREQAQEALSWEVQVNQAVAELSRKLLSPASIDDIFYLTLEHARRLTGSAYGFVGYIDPEAGHLVVPTLSRDIWDTCEVADKDIVFKKFMGLWGWVLKNRKPLLTNAPADDPRSSGTPPGHVPIHRFLSAPALIDETLVGQVSVANADHDYTDRELDVIERFADLYAIAIQRQRAEDELARHRDHLEERVRERTAELEVTNNELEAFAYSVSHDLRAPLRAMDGFSQILFEEYKDGLDTQGKDYLQRLRSAAQRMGQLIDDILSLSRIIRSEMNIQEADLSQMVRAISETLRTAQPERKAEFIIAEGVRANVDMPLFRIFLENLMGNAWKFSSKKPFTRIEFGILPQEDRPAYFIRDNGAGFDMRYAQKLFGAFQRLHTASEFQGTGIGLATVQRIIRRHGGRIWAEGKVDQGAAFYFSLA